MAKRKARTKKDDNVIFLQKLVDEQAGAVKNGPKVRKFTTHDLKSIRPLTFGQQHMFESYFSGNMIVANGSAGTGKSFSAVYLALTDLLMEDSEYDKIIIVRSAVSARSNGFLPGTLDEKLEPFEAPYKDILAALLKHGKATKKNTCLLRWQRASSGRLTDTAAKA